MPSLAKQPEQKFKKPNQISSRDELRSVITKYLNKKLAQKLNEPSIQRLPWSQMTAGDIINWPPEVEFKRFGLMTANQIAKIYELVQEDKLDFSQEFISRLKIKRKETDKRDVLKSDIRKYLADKLTKKLHVRSIKVPWSEITAKDIINWPPDVEFRNVELLSTVDLKRIHELAKDDILDFSPKFLSRFKINSKVNKRRDVLRLEVSQFLLKKLAQKLNLESFKRLPWSEMTAKDIMHWPPEVEFKSFDTMNTEEIRRIYEMVTDDLLDFSPEFISRFKINSKATGERDNLRSDVTKYLGDKLATKLKIERVKRLPWSKMKAGDILNWPPEVEFRKLTLMSAEEVKRLNELAKKDKLDFSSDFLLKLSQRVNGQRLINEVDYWY
jgi:hypothetical protein